MIPFLKRSQDASASAPIESERLETVESSDDYDSLEAAAEDLIAAVHSKDAKAVCVALRAAFELMDSEPHEEGPHTNEKDKS
jgi:hypothetical protein